MRLYRGTVVNNIDPDKGGRVQVSIKELDGSGDGINSVTNETLAWAEVIGSTMFGNVGGIGGSSVLHNGTEVYVFYSQDNTSSTPIVLGTVQGYTQDQSARTNGAKDPNGEFPYKSRLGTTSMAPELQAGNDAYAYTQMIETRTGHKIILGDVSGQEYVKILHKSGSYIHFEPDGSIHVNCVKTMTTDVAENYNINVTGNYALKVNGTILMKSDGVTNMKNPHTTIDTAMVSCTANVESNSDMCAGGVSVMNHTHPYDHPVHVSGPANTEKSNATSSVSVSAVEASVSRLASSSAATFGEVKDPSTVLISVSQSTKKTPTDTIQVYTCILANGDAIVVNEKQGVYSFASSEMKNKALNVKYDVSTESSDYQKKFINGAASGDDDLFFANSNKILKHAN